jgi:hypothetical protein
MKRANQLIRKRIAKVSPISAFLMKQGGIITHLPNAR